MPVRLPGKVDPRTRNASAFIPTLLSGCLFWGEIGLEGGYSNNDPLTQITDWSGNGYHLTPYLGGDGAEWRTDGTFPYLQRGSSSSAYHNASFPAFGSNSFTLVVAAIHTDAEFDAVPFAIGGDMECHRSWAPTRARVFLWCDDDFYTNADPDVPIVMTSTVTSTDQYIYTQHEELGHLTYTDMDVYPGLWALDWFNEAQPFVGKLYGVNIYNRVLSAPEIVNLEDYWLAKMPA